MKAKKSCSGGHRFLLPEFEAIARLVGRACEVWKIRAAETTVVRVTWALPTAFDRR